MFAWRGRPFGTPAEPHAGVCDGMVACALRTSEVISRRLFPGLNASSSSGAAGLRVAPSIGHGSEDHAIERLLKVALIDVDVQTEARGHVWQRSCERGSCSRRKANAAKAERSVGPTYREVCHVAVAIQKTSVAGKIRNLKRVGGKLLVDYESIEPETHFYSRSRCTCRLSWISGRAPRWRKTR